MTGNPKIALVHDWLSGMRGGEKVLEVLCELFPDATLFTLVHRKGSVSQTIEWMKIKTSFIQHLPMGQTHYQHYLPFYPAAAKNLNLRGFDLVISSSHAAAKAVTVSPGALHICYCHTPMRYIWDQYEQYFGKGQAPFPVRVAMKMILGYLREWDKRTANNVNYFIANSHNVQERIKRIYGRDSFVIYPPVNLSQYPESHGDKGYYLIVSALVPYKRVDIAVEAFNQRNDKLLIIGKGPELTRLQAMAKNNITFIGWAGDEELVQYYAGCKGLVFPGVEDFGIVPLEAMASGKAVIALARGGLLETVVDGKTGVFFNDQSTGSLNEALQKFESINFDPAQIRGHAMQFDRAIFKKRIESYIRERWEERGKS